MVELMRASIALVNLPFTVLLVLVVIYWIGVIVGAADIGWLDTDLEMDADVDLDVDVDLDADVDVDLDADADAEVDTGAGVLRALLAFLNVGEVPVMVIVSVAVLVGWCLSVLSNHFVNPGRSLLFGLPLMAVNLVVSLLAAAVITRPLRRVFSRIDDPEAHATIVLRTGTVTTSEVNADFGQVEIPAKGAPITINARTTGDVVLKKGDTVIVYDEDKEKGIYFVEKYH
jgi:hypothetical protein